MPKHDCLTDMSHVDSHTQENAEMQFNGLFMTQNRRFSFNIVTPTALTPTTVTIKSSFGEMSVIRHIETYSDLEKHMISLARIVGGGDDESVRELAKQIGQMR